MPYYLQRKDKAVSRAVQYQFVATGSLCGGGKTRLSIPIYGDYRLLARLSRSFWARLPPLFQYFSHCSSVKKRL